LDLIEKGENSPAVMDYKARSSELQSHLEDMTDYIKDIEFVVERNTNAEVYGHPNTVDVFN